MGGVPVFDFRLYLVCPSVFHFLHLKITMTGLSLKDFYKE